MSIDRDRPPTPRMDLVSHNLARTLYELGPVVHKIASQASEGELRWFMQRLGIKNLPTDRIDTRWEGMITKEVELLIHVIEAFTGLKLDEIDAPPEPEIDAPFSWPSIVSQRAKDKLAGVFLKHGVTDMPAVDAMITYEDILSGKVPMSQDKMTKSDRIWLIKTCLQQLIDAIPRDGWDELKFIDNTD